MGDNNPEELGVGVNLMISGASIAFFTSILGVSSSLEHWHLGDHFD